MQFFKSNMTLEIPVLFLLKFNEQRNGICDASKLVVQKNLQNIDVCTFSMV